VHAHNPYYCGISVASRYLIKTTTLCATKNKNILDWCLIVCFNGVNSLQMYLYEDAILYFTLQTRNFHHQASDEFTCVISFILCFACVGSPPTSMSLWCNYKTVLCIYCYNNLLTSLECFCWLRWLNSLNLCFAFTSITVLHFFLQFSLETRSDTTPGLHRILPTQSGVSWILCNISFDSKLLIYGIFCLLM